MIILTIIVIQIPYSLRTITDLEKAVPQKCGVRKAVLPAIVLPRELRSEATMFLLPLRRMDEFKRVLHTWRI